MNENERNEHFATSRNHDIPTIEWATKSNIVIPTHFMHCISDIVTESSIEDFKVVTKAMPSRKPKLAHNSKLTNQALFKFVGVISLCAQDSRSF